MSQKDKQWKDCLYSLWSAILAGTLKKLPDLKGREKEEEKMQRKGTFHLLINFLMATLAGAGSDWSQELKTSRFPVWATKAQIFGRSPAVFLSTLSRSQTGNGAARTWTGIHTGHWCHRRWLNLPTILLPACIYFTCKAKKGLGKE